MKHYIDVINGMREIFIEMNKGVVSDEEICLVTNIYKKLLNEMDEAYRCISTLIVDDNLTKKTRIRIEKAIFLWRDLKLLVAPSTHLLGDHIVNQIISIEGSIANKTEGRIE